MVQPDVKHVGGTSSDGYRVSYVAPALIESRSGLLRLVSGSVKIDDKPGLVKLTADLLLSQQTGC